MQIASRLVHAKRYQSPTPCFPYTASQENHARNLQVDQNSTDVTVSWDIVDGYYSSSYISYFYLYYQYGSSTRLLYIPYRSATWNIINNDTTTFMYTTSLENFNEEEYIMWVRVYRRLDPQYVYTAKQLVTFSKLRYIIQHAHLDCNLIDHVYIANVCDNFTMPISADIPVQEIILELKVHFWPTQTCSDFVVSCFKCVAIYWPHLLQ